jgi:hypothetical protein
MFTWECPTCGREIDIAESECPSCSQRKKAADAAAAQTPVTAALPPRPAKARQAPRAAGTSWGSQTKHLALFGLLVLLTAAAAAYLAMPELFRPDTAPEEAAVAEGSGDAGSAYLGDIEVAGIRAVYDADFKTKVKAVVINHGESAQSNVDLQVALRTRQSSTRDTPLASFRIQLDEAIGPNESREVEVDLTTFGTLASLPPWHQLRVDLSRPQSAQSAPAKP